MEKINQTQNPVPGTPTPAPQPAPQSTGALPRQNPPSRYNRFIYLPDSREFLNMEHIASVVFDPDSESPVFDESGNPVASAELIAFVTPATAPWMPGEDETSYEQQATPYTGRDAAALFLGLVCATNGITPDQVPPNLTMEHVRRYERLEPPCKVKP